MWCLRIDLAAAVNTFVGGVRDIADGGVFVAVPHVNENLLRALSERRCAVLAGEAHPQVCHQILEGGEKQREQRIAADEGKLVAEVKDQRCSLLRIFACL